MSNTASDYTLPGEIFVVSLLEDLHVALVFSGSIIWCTDTSDLRHFGPKTFRHWCRNVQWTLRHHRKNPRHFGTSAHHRKNPRHFGTSAEVSARHFGVLDISAPLTLRIQLCHINLFI